MRELPVLVRDAETEGCRCDGGQPKNFSRPCLLLLLAEASAHGYELIERLRPFGFDLSDPASVYKTLRLLEGDGHVTSEWELSARGPARRVYSITDDGREMLQAWAHTLAKNREILSIFLGRVTELSAGPATARVIDHSTPSATRRGGEV
jgi:PadR family transcriptional regulator, regulatory protein PadR